MKVEGKRVGFEPLEEPWARYKLQDGTMIRLKLVVSDVLRTNQTDATGAPVYAVKSSNVLAVDPPEESSEVH